MKRFSRRDFLRLMMLGAGSLALSKYLTACGPKPTPILPTYAPTSLPSTTPASTTGLMENTPSPAAATAGTPLSAPDLVVARGSDPEEMVRRALEAYGGMQTFVPKGANVVVKPNICVAYHTYEYAATTNPWLVGALVKLAFEAGAGRVQVFDFPFGGSAQEAYVRSGIEEQVKAAGGEMMPMPDFKYVKTDIPNGVDLKKTKAFKDALEADVLIDVPIAKHHGSTRLSLGMKNLMGLVLDRGAIHNNLGQRIADLTTLFRPKLTVVDAIRMLMRHGPSGGNLDDVQKMDTIVVSPDIVAADSYAATLFGLRPHDIEYISAASQMGLGNSDLGTLKIEELSVGS
ncbi:hypothetical protein ANAEL_01809 [Anaerolineales bacterium]|nr:hypothetical protein ANAEL_01809 [Anaerolineales bacterium]